MTTKNRKMSLIACIEKMLKMSGDDKSLRDGIIIFGLTLNANGVDDAMQFLKSRPDVFAIFSQTVA